MNLNFSIILLMSFLLLSSCEDPVIGDKFYRLKYDNNSSGAIYFYDYDGFSNIQYPDTFLPPSDPNATKIGSGGRFYNDRREPWSEEIETLTADTLTIFFFDATIYEDSAWSDIVNQYLILKRYDLSIEDLESLDFIVPYPPNEFMEGMQMYPPE